MRNGNNLSNMGKGTTQNSNPKTESSDKGTNVKWTQLFGGFIAMLCMWFLCSACSKFINIIFSYIATVGAFIGSLLSYFESHLNKKSKKIAFPIMIGTFLGGLFQVIVNATLYTPLETISSEPKIWDSYQPALSQPSSQYSQDGDSSKNGASSQEIQSPSLELPQDYIRDQEPQPQDKEENIQPPLALILPDEGDKVKRNVLNDIYAVTGDPSFGEKLELTAENLPANKAYLEGIIGQLVDTDVHSGDSEVRLDNYFTSLTVRANNLQKDIKDNGPSIDRQFELIRLREEAYKLHNTCGLRRLLAYDYAELARLQEHEKDYENAYQCYIRAIEYGFLHIRALSQADDDYYISVFNIAVWCAKIGDIADLDDESAKEAHYLSACLFQITLNNNNSESFSNRLAKCYKYTADEYHKLHLLTCETDRLQTVYYFNFAFQFYQQALEFPQYTKSAAENLIQLCDWADNYISQYGSSKEMLDKDQYNKLQDEYDSLALTGNLV